MLPSTYFNYTVKSTRMVRRYQRNNQKPQIEEGHIIPWRNKKEQKDKQRSTKHYTESLRSKY